MITKLLSGHTSPETSFLVDDYPYGFRLRCKIRYWLEHHPKRGTRFVSQTTNPKRPGTVWNKPKASTYADVAGAMYFDEAGHVAWDSLNYYPDAAECKVWLARFGAALTPEVHAKVDALIITKTNYERAKATGMDYRYAGLVATLADALGYDKAFERVSARVAAAAAAQAAGVVAGIDAAGCADAAVAAAGAPLHAGPLPV